MQIGSRVLEGEIAAQRENYERDVSLLREVLEIETQLAYNEPPDWFFPVRHNLGAILLGGGKPMQAEQIYRADLNEFPDNGWSLFVL